MLTINEKNLSNLPKRCKISIHIIFRMSCPQTKILLKKSDYTLLARTTVITTIRTLRLVAQSLIDFKHMTLLSGIKHSVLHWHLRQPKLFEKASCGELNDMFLWAKACRSISKPPAMLWQKFESVAFHWVVFIMARVRTPRMLVWMCCVSACVVTTTFIFFEKVS